MRKGIVMKKIIYILSVIIIIFSMTSYGAEGVSWYTEYNIGSLGNSADMHAEITSSERYSGNNSMKLYFNHMETPNTYLSFKTAVPAGTLSWNKTYKFSFMHKGSGILAGRAYYWEGNERKEAGVFAWDKASYDWEKTEYTITAGFWKSYMFDINVEGARNSSEPAIVYIDDLKLVEVDSNGNEKGVNLINNPGFETAVEENVKLDSEESHNGGTAYINLKLVSNSGYGRKMNVFFAVYDEDGKLSSVDMRSEVFENGEEKNYNLQYDYVAGNVFKAFVWRENQTPYRNVYEIGFDDINFKFSESAFTDMSENKLPELKSLRSECEAKGINCAYETVNIATIEDFAVYGKNQLSVGNSERAEYIYNCLSDLYSETRNALSGYLDGSKVPKEVVKYVHGSNTVSGLSEYATSTAGANRPTFFMGYGHFSGTLMANLDLFKNLGVNIIQVETHMSEFVSPDGNGGFTFNSTAVTNFINNVLNPARDRNIKVILLISPHYIPDWFTNLYPEDSGIVTSTKWRELLKVYIDGLVSKVSRYPALHSICVTNEPGYNATANKYDTPLYVEYLKEKYTDISKLNALYGTSYGGFESVVMPTSMPDTNAGAGKINAYSDYIEFNDKLFAEYHLYLKNTVANVAKGKPIHSKMVDVFGPNDNNYYRSLLNRGTDTYEFTKVFDVNGCDGTTALNHCDITTKSAFYDMMQSFNPAPVINSEDHIILDGNADYSPEQNKHVSLDMWNGAVHGRTTSVLWVWERTDLAGGSFGGSIAHRPDCVASVGKITLDLNRLAYEITALQNVDSDVAIYYDTNARFRNRYMMNAMDKCHKALSANGQKVSYVSDETILEGALGSVSVLVIPDALHVSDSTVAKITEFKNAGGKVIAAGGNCLVYDEHGNRRNSDGRSSAITETVAMTKTSNYMYDSASLTALTNTMNKYFEREIKVTDKSGNICSDIEYLVTEYEGKNLIHICNHNMYSSYNLTAGNGNVTDLISGKTVNLSDFTIKPGEFMLLW